MGTNTRTLTAALAGLCLTAGIAFAEQNATLTVNCEQALATQAPAPAHLENMDEIYSGCMYRTTETQVLQLDDFDNPAFVFVDVGIDLYNTVDGSEGKSCANCHENVEDFAGLRAQMPRVNEEGNLESMAEVVNECRTERMGAGAGASWRSATAGSRSMRWARPSRSNLQFSWPPASPRTWRGSGPAPW